MAAASAAEVVGPGSIAELLEYAKQTYVRLPATLHALEAQRPEAFGAATPGAGEGQLLQGSAAASAAALGMTPETVQAALRQFDQVLLCRPPQNPSQRHEGYAVGCLSCENSLTGHVSNGGQLGTVGQCGYPMGTALRCCATMSHPPGSPYPGPLSPSPPPPDQALGAGPVRHLTLGHTTLDSSWGVVRAGGSVGEAVHQPF